MALEFNFAIRLLEKFLRETANTKFLLELCAYINDPSTGKTLLHEIAALKLTIATSESAQKFLRLLFTHRHQSLPDFSVLKTLDKYGTSPVHYACHLHNFAFVDFALEQFKANSLELLTFKDTLGHSAYSLLFWQIGRVSYGAEAKDKIRGYTLNCTKKSDNFEFISKAYFPLTSSIWETPKSGKLNSAFFRNVNFDEK